jgi:hypothetical protein
MKKSCSFILFILMFAYMSGSAQDKTKEIKQTNNTSKDQTVTPGKNNQVQPKTIIKDTLDIKSILNKGKTVVTGNDTSKVNWTEQYIEAKGWTVMDKVTYTIEGQAELMARSGAIAVAQRNLLEIIEGVRVVGETTVKDCITTDDYVYKKVDGIVKGAEMVGEPVVKGNIVEVTMRIPMYQNKGASSSLAGTLLDPAKNIIAKGLKVRPADSTNKQTSNKNAKGVNPSLFPVVVDSTGNIVFDYSKYFDPKSGKFPQYIEMTKEISDALNLNKESSQVISGAEQLASGQIKIPKEQTAKISKWVNIASKIIQIGKFALLLI